MRVLPLAEAKAKLSQLVAGLESDDEEITITKNGRAAAVLLSYEDFERWKETVLVLSDRSFRQEIRNGIAQLKKGRSKKFRTRDLDLLFGSNA